MSQRAAVLIVDDDNIFLTITASMVKKMGFQTMTAHDGIEAIAVFQKHADEIGCVILDIQMPQMNGIAAFQQLRNIRGDIQVIIASGYLDKTNLEQLALLHPVGYLKKPIAYQTLSDTLTECFPPVR